MLNKSENEGVCLSCGGKFEAHDSISRTCAKLQKARRTLHEIRSLLARLERRFQSPSVKKCGELAGKALTETA